MHEMIKAKATRRIIRLLSKECGAGRGPAGWEALLRLGRGLTGTGAGIRIGTGYWRLDVDVDVGVDGDRDGGLRMMWMRACE